MQIDLSSLSQADILKMQDIRFLDEDTELFYMLRWNANLQFPVRIYGQAETQVTQWARSVLSDLEEG